MEAAIAIIFGIGNIVLFLNQTYVILLEQTVGKKVYVINKGTDDSDSCNIMYLIQRVKTEREVSSAQLFTNAFRGFHPCLYHFNRITLMIQKKPLI